MMAGEDRTWRRRSCFTRRHGWTTDDDDDGNEEDSELDDEEGAANYTWGESSKITFKSAVQCTLISS
jgi:hypothetical protein